MRGELGDAGGMGAPARRVRGIDGLRAVAAGAIVVHHVHLYGQPRTSAGDATERFVQNLAFGVTLFFALSGFLLYRPIVDALLHGARQPSVRTYLRNRALRIVPAYWVILVPTAVLLGATLVPRGGGFELGRLEPDLLLRAGLLVQNYTPASLGAGIGPAWSLAVEVVFYLALPLLALLAFRLVGADASRARRVAGALVPPALMLITGLASKACVALFVTPQGGDPGWDPDWRSVLERSFLVQADLFAFGMALAVLHVLWTDGRIRLPARWRPAAVGIIVAVMAVSTARLRIGGQLGTSPYNTAVALAAALLLALVVIPPDRGVGRLVRVLDMRGLVVVGLWSYSLFLWHEPLTRWLADRGSTVTGPGAFVPNLLLIGGVSLALAGLTYRYVEQPFLRRRHRARYTTGRPADARKAGAS